ncbi:MAG: hypothetical protein GY820_23995, partial [Gammaproteobacteria bacterium]|nr:hypothetical protein [Gammaproteobacteria bacterium]
MTAPVFSESPSVSSPAFVPVSFSVYSPVPLSPPDLTSEENALIVRLPEVLGLPDSLHDGGDVCRDIRFI